MDIEISGGMLLIYVVILGVCIICLWSYAFPEPPKKEEKKEEKKEGPKFNEPKAPGVPGGIAPKVISELNLIKGLINGYEDPADLVNKIADRIVEIAKANDDSLLKLEGDIKKNAGEWKSELTKFMK
jgi:hypothetical protein